MAPSPALKIAQEKNSPSRSAAARSPEALQPYTILFLVAFLLLTELLAAIPSDTVVDMGIGAIIVLGLTVGHVAYFVLQERRNGRTLGKRMVGIRVIDGQGAVPSTRALVKRTLPLVIEYCYIFALIGMTTSTYRQRYGDRWADTYVVADESVN